MNVPAIGLITASLDLQLVRLIRGAIAENNVGNVQPKIHPGGTSSNVDFEPRKTIHPTPRFEPRPVHTPEPVITSPEVIRCKPIELEACKLVPEAFGPLPAPWQMLLREKVWNRPVATPEGVIGPDALARYRASSPRIGDMLDSFL